MDKRLERILPRVQKPARYVGGEYHQTVKDPGEIDTRVAFCFPDTYEIGMSNLGLRILYCVVNRMAGVWCERVFTPWGDMEDEMRAAGLPLYALESHDPVADFDMIAEHGSEFLKSGFNLLIFILNDYQRLVAFYVTGYGTGTHVGFVSQNGIADIIVMRNLNTVE